MRQKVTQGCAFAGLAALVVAMAAFIGYWAYEWGVILVEILGLFHALLVIGAIVTLCIIADRVAPRRDGGSWFGVLLDFMVGDEDCD
jgi:hypothetical protein